MTTTVGIVYFGAVEGNPFVANLVQTNLPAFSVIKLGSAFFIGFLFYQAEKTLNRQMDTKTKNFTKTRFLLRIAYLASASFLIFAVVNNIWVVARVTS